MTREPPRSDRPSRPVDLQVEAVAGAGPQGVRAAGAVLWRRACGRVEVAVVHRPRYDDWSLPKGKINPGEHPLAAAAREVREETGHAVALGRPLGRQRYVVADAAGQVVPKVVHYWAGRALDGEHEPGTEVDALAWLDPGEAVARLSYPRDRELLAAFTGAEVDTVPVVLLRHAHAVGRSGWDGVDDDRPLTPRGRAQSVALVAVLAALGPLRVLSSPARRCLETLTPYAESSASPAHLEPRLSREAGAGQAPSEVAVEALRAAATGVGTLLCTHREDLAGLLAPLAAAGLSTVPASLGTAEVLVAHVDATGRVLVAQKHQP